MCKQGAVMKYGCFLYGSKKKTDTEWLKIGWGWVEMKIQAPVI